VHWQSALDVDAQRVGKSSVIGGFIIVVRYHEFDHKIPNSGDSLLLANPNGRETLFVISCSLARVIALRDQLVETNLLYRRKLLGRRGLI
jgi:hypothetical protein